MMKEPKGLLGFASRQLEFFEKQSIAVQRGDLVAAKVASDQLRRSLPALARLMRQQRQSGGEQSDGVKEIERMIEEMKKLHHNATDALRNGHDQLAQLLHEFKKGRQLLSHYKSGKDKQHKFFDIRG